MILLLILLENGTNKSPLQLHELVIVLVQSPTNGLNLFVQKIALLAVNHDKRALDGHNLEHFPPRNCGQDCS